jgi:hypothetical protein
MRQVREPHFQQAAEGTRNVRGEVDVGMPDRKGFVAVHHLEGAAGAQRAADPKIHEARQLHAASEALALRPKHCFELGFGHRRFTLVSRNRQGSCLLGGMSGCRKSEAHGGRNHQSRARRHHLGINLPPAGHWPSAIGSEGTHRAACMMLNSQQSHPPWQVTSLAPQSSTRHTLAEKTSQ